MPVIHLEPTDKPYKTVERELGKTNFGLWCVKCDEFFAIGIGVGEVGAHQIKFESNGPIIFKCPFCSAVQKREVSEIAELKLTEGLKRRPPRPATAN
jgi:hypothetical protein